MNFFIASVPFFVIALVHLIQALLENHKAANITKILLMPSLILAVILSGKAGSPTGILVIIALVAGTIGDYFLIKPIKPEAFIVGVLAFFIGHGFYIAALFPLCDFSLIPLWLVIVLFLTYALIVNVVYKVYGSPKGFKGVAEIVYSLMLVLINFLSITILFNSADKNAIILFIATCIFITSDSTLGFTLFKKDFPKSRFVIMLTYVTAQFLLVYGLLC